jgi:hypothetical protein
MITKISPFLQKKFFEYADEHVAKRTSGLKYENYDNATDALALISEYALGRDECAFFVPMQVPGKRKEVFLASPIDIGRVLEQVLSDYSVCILYYADGGMTISADRDETHGMSVLTSVFWGTCEKLVDVLVEKAGGSVYD